MNIYLIIAIIAIITLVLTVSFFKEDFTYNYEMMIATPSKEVIRYKLIKSLYFKKLNSTDLETRQLQGKTIDEIIDFYMENILEINSNEKIILNNTIRNILDNLEEKNKKQFMFKDPWQFVKFTNRIENGFPHTHDKLILLPERMVETANQHKVILVHEQVHVFQRFNPTLFHMLYTNHWNFEKKNIENLETVESLSRTNPDGVDNNWVFTYKNVNIILIALYDSGASSISHATKYGIYLDENFRVKQPIHKERLEKIPEFIEFFGEIGSNSYHPNEIAAEIISKDVFNRLNSDVTSKPCYINYKKWWNNIN